MKPMEPEELVHKEVLRRATRSVDSIPDLWRKDRRIYSSILLWPNDSVRTTTGERFSGVVFSEVPTGLSSNAERAQYFARVVKQVNAYAILLVEELDDCVHCIFESSYGTETWRLPIKDHGGVRVLGAATKRTNAESVGVIWKAN